MGSGCFLTPTPHSLSIPQRIKMKKGWKYTLGEKFSEFEYKERNVSDSAELSLESLYFCVEGFSRSIRWAVFEVVYDSCVVVLHCRLCLTTYAYEYADRQPPLTGKS